MTLAQFYEAHPSMAAVKELMALFLLDKQDEDERRAKADGKKLVADREMFEIPIAPRDF